MCDIGFEPRLDPPPEPEEDLDYDWWNPWAVYDPEDWEEKT